MRFRNLLPIVLCGVFSFGLVSYNTHHSTQRQEKEALGKLIFHDASLSEPPGQSCATCHEASRGFADVEGRAVSEGAVQGLFSQRNSMTVSYSRYVPSLFYDQEEDTYVGGLFWDGRSPSLQSQAGEPFLNPVEMGNKDRDMVVLKIRRAPYYKQLIQIYGKTTEIDTLYAYITDALSVYQKSDEVNPFTSKFDAWKKDKYKFTRSEKRGYELFKDKGKCAECHILDKDEQARHILFTDHTYDNLGIPRNPHNPHYSVPERFFLLAKDSIDYGLGTIVGKEGEYGKFRVPTLRNIELTAPYGHNGYFKTLEEIVHFYNVRDISDEFPPAECPSTVNKDELGNLKLTPQEEADIITFMKTLTDGFLPVKKAR